MKTIILSAIESKTSGALSAAVCLLLGAANIHAQGRPPEGDQGESSLQQARQRMMDRRHEDFPEEDSSSGDLAPNRSGPQMSAAEERGGPAPFMRDGGRGFGHPGLPGAFRPRPDGARGFARPPMSGGRPELEGFGPYSGDMDRGPRHAGRFQEGPGGPSGPAPFMRDGGRGFGRPGLPGAFRPRPDGAPGFARPPMSGGRPGSEGFGPYSGDMDRGPRHAGRFQEGPGGPAPFMRGGDRGFGRPGLPGAFRARPDGGPGLARPPMSGGRPELEGLGPYSGDMDRGPRNAGRFEDGPGGPGGPAAFTRDWEGKPQEE